MADKTYALIIKLANGETLRAEFTAPQGEKGDPGTGVTILGSYNSEEELNEAHPSGNSGDAYLINGELYVWSETVQKWQNVGNIKGPQGDPGKEGPQGPPGEPGEEGPQGVGILEITVREV